MGLVSICVPKWGKSGPFRAVELRVIFSYSLFFVVHLVLRKLIF